MHNSAYTNTFTYLGSKFSILPWLLPKLPRTKSFVEVFGGSMVVTINREPSPIETYNDINSRVVNFFRVLRTQPDELITSLHLTPYSIQEYDEAWIVDTDTPLEAARKFFVRIRQSYLAAGGQNRRKGWQVATRESRCKISEAVNKYLASVDGLAELVNRLKVVQIENRQWDYVMKAYDTKQTLFYCDPPYDLEKRSGGNDYEFDFTEQDHHALHEQCRQTTGLIAVSGYDSDFMKDLWKDFQFTKGPVRKNNRTNRTVHECLWTNYDPATVTSKNQIKIGF